MTSRRTTFSSSLLFLLAAAACGDSAGDGGAGGTSSTTSTQAGSTTSSKATTGSLSNTTTASTTTNASSVDASSSSVTSSSTGGGPTTPYVVTIRDAQNQMPIAGLNVCESGAMPANCQPTNAMGEATLAVPMGVDFTIEYSGAAYRKHLLRVRAGADGTVFTLAISNTTAPLIFTLLGQTEDPTKGTIGGLITNGMNGVAGSLAALTPDSGAGPFYTANGLPSASAMATSGDGLFLMLNVDPGNPDVQATSPGLACEPQIGVVGATPNATVVPVEAGAFTIASSFTCL